MKSKTSIMYKISTVTILFFFMNLSYAQKDLSKDNIKYKNEVKTTILNFFEGFHAGDTSKIRKTIDANLSLQTIVKTKEGITKVAKTDTQKFLNAIQNRPVEQRWDERLLLFKIEADSTIANAWTPYEFYLNDKFSHCGVNVFQLYNDGKSWRILTLTDTRTREGCK